MSDYHDCARGCGWTGPLCESEIDTAIHEYYWSKAYGRMCPMCHGPIKANTKRAPATANFAYGSCGEYLEAGK